MKRYANLVSSLFFLLVATTSVATARAANPGGSADAGDDAAPDGGPDADLTPEGIQPTTTPDNFGCAAHGRGLVSGGAPVGPGRLGARGELVLAGGAAIAMAAVARRRAARRRSS